MALNIAHLRVFALAVRLGGVSAAARALGLTQPAVSRTLRELERSTGVQLLERSRRGVNPTSAGRELLAHALAVEAAERAAEESMTALRELTRGTLHIGASTTIATYALPSLIAAFSRSYPGVTLRLSSAHTRLLVPLVRQYEVDVALAEAPVHDPRITSSRWLTDEMIVIASPTHPLAQRARLGPVAPEQLSSELFLLREAESGTRTVVLRGLRAAGIVPSRTMAVDGTEVIKQLAAESLGIGIVSRFAAADQLAVGRLVSVPVSGLAITRPFNRLAVPGHRPSPAARAFLRLLASHARAVRAPQD
jgi:DNA-binding transcriptional LysR family regulator